MRKDSLTLIRELTLLDGISGYESEVASYIEKILDGIGTKTRDRIGNLVYTIEGTDPEASTILLAAHMDEIGFLVSDITSDGFLRVQQVGGWNPATLSSAQVEIIDSEGGRVRGVFGMISPHFLPEGKRGMLPSLDDLFIDVGVSSAQEVRDLLLVEIGARVLPVSQFSYREKSGTMVSKSFDDRIGVASLVDLAFELAEEPVKNTVHLAFTVQEEVGARGAAVLSNYIKADYALIVEGAPADDVPGGAKHPQTSVGKGAHVRLFDPTHIGSVRLLSLIDKVCAASEIKIQKSVRKAGGTDAAKIALAGDGIDSVVVGVPVRYAHSHYGVTSLNDYVELLKLLFAVCEYMG